MAVSVRGLSASLLSLLSSLIIFMSLLLSVGIGDGSPVSSLFKFIFKFWV
jgi:hypothetical protein